MIKKNYLKTLFSIFIVLYLIVVGTIYSLLNNYSVSEHRLFDLRPFPEQYRASLSYLFMDRSFEKTVDIVCMGDSQAYGYMYPNKYVFSSYLGKQIQKNVVNISVQDGKLDDQILLLKHMISKGYRVNTLVLGLNMNHSGQASNNRLDVNKKSNYAIGMFEYTADFVKLALRPNPTKLPAIEKLSLGKSKGLYKLNHFHTYKAKLKELIPLTKQVSKSQLFYIEPYAPSSLEYNDCDMTLIHKAADEILKICQDNNIHCNNYQPHITDKDFRDLVHLNIHGHKSLASLIEQDLIDIHKEGNK